jgi:hypothetical protein
MPVPLPRPRAVVLLLALAAAPALSLSASAMASFGDGSLYTQTNDPGGNSVQRFHRSPDRVALPRRHVRDRRRRAGHARRPPGRRRPER